MEPLSAVWWLLLCSWLVDGCRVTGHGSGGFFFPSRISLSIYMLGLPFSFLPYHESGPFMMDSHPPTQQYGGLVPASWTVGATLCHGFESLPASHLGILPHSDSRPLYGFAGDCWTGTG